MSARRLENCVWEQAGINPRKELVWGMVGMVLVGIAVLGGAVVL